MSSIRFCRPLPLVIAVCIIAMSGDLARSQRRVAVRNCLADSIAWIQQELPIPGVVAGNAIWFDYNSDGRLDILMAGMSELGPVSGIYKNDSTSFTRIQADICPLVSERGLSWGDIDNDGDLDFAIEGRADTTSTQVRSIVYRNDDGVFSDTRANLMDLSGGSITWIDSDNDGHLELLISGSPDAGNSFYTKMYRIINGSFYEVPTSLPGVWGSSIAWTDYEPDGFPDVVVSGYGYGVQTRLFRNAMYRGVIGFDEVYAPVQGGETFRPVNSGGLIWFDYNNDGYSDLLVTGAGIGGAVAELYRNNHDATFTRDTISLKGECVSAVAVGDYDNDGYLDLAISGGDDFFTGSNPTTRIYHNEGGNSFIDIGAELIGTWFGSLDWGDYDRDGRLDLLVTGATIPRTQPTWGMDLKPVTLLYRNTVEVQGNAVPSVPQGLTAQVTGQNVALQWQPSTDTETDQKAISYNLMVGTQPGRFDVVSPLSNTESGFRRLPKAGTQGTRPFSTLMNLPAGRYYWKVQAVDNQYSGSLFSEEGEFTVETTSAGPEQGKPGTFRLDQNFPNPFNPGTVVRFQLPVVSDVKLSVFDLLGREVKVLVDETMEAGYHEVRFDGSKLASGTYLYRLEAGEFVQTRSMLVLK